MTTERHELYALTHHDVVWFEILVDDVSAVQKVQAFTHPSDDCGLHRWAQLEW